MIKKIVQHFRQRRARKKLGLSACCGATRLPAGFHPGEKAYCENCGKRC